ncbi:cytochrome P450 3A41-like isoform X2 [Babylonia areolata]
MEGEEKGTVGESWLHSISCATEWFYSMSKTGWLLMIVLVLLLMYLWKSYRTFCLFSKMGIPCPRALPDIGNFWDMIKLGAIGALQKYGKQCGKVYGMSSFIGPAVVVSDLDMLKEIFVKQFHCFPNRTVRPIFNYKPFTDFMTEAQGDHWKHLRVTLSPTFSSGKIRRMTHAIQRITVTFKDHLNEVASRGEMIELKDICSRFTLDVIGAAAFGIDVSSIHDPDNMYVKRFKEILNPSKLHTALFVISPKLMVLLHKWGFITKTMAALDFFFNIMDQALKDRQVDTQKHDDFLQLLIDAEMKGDSGGPVDAEINFGDQLATSEKWTRKGLTKDEMKANAFLFIFAGYETVSTAVAFTLFCLAHNPECLREAQAEVDSKLGKKLVDSESASDLTYVGMCINETMRLYPTGFMLTRATTEETEIGGVKFTKDMGVVIPVCELHMDPNVWPQPEKFDPLRHTNEARAERHPFSFMPFGMGPRNCIAMRLAQLEVRMAVASVLQHFTPLVCEKSVYPIKIKKFAMQAEGGVWVKLQKRE